MPTRLTRRAVIGVAAVALGAGSQLAAAQSPESAFSYPVGLPGRVLGDGFRIRHGYATENTWYNPSWLHAGEDYYLADGSETGGVGVYAAAPGEVVFVGSDYPGPVVILRHTPDLYSMYGHLAYDVPVVVGQTVARGDALGTILTRTDGRAPSHLHFELRTFLTLPEVNGDAPRYAYGCGFECPPGPGYWPIDAPEHPSAIGWRNPTHAINGRLFGGAGGEVVVAETGGGEAALWSASPGEGGAEQTGVLALAPGDHYPLLGVDAGPLASEGTSAEAYRPWYRVETPEGQGWLQAAVPSAFDTGSDGRPSSVEFVLLPAVGTG